MKAQNVKLISLRLPSSSVSINVLSTNHSTILRTKNLTSVFVIKTLIRRPAATKTNPKPKTDAKRVASRRGPFKKTLRIIMILLTH